MNHEVQILLVEDNPADARLVTELLKEGQLSHHILHVSDGVEALTYLRAQDAQTPPSRPDLILLDLNLPRKDGRELLAEIKADERLRRIPVVVLTTSQADDDVARAYSLYANCYITKPVDLDQFARVVKSIEDFWMMTAKLPPRAS
jgi:two-component system, chemotaxis family, response regulator Rcp1